MSLRDLLIRAYPRAWREEYGLELADILAHRRLTLELIANVLASALRQHLRGDPWKVCALGLSLWTSGLMAAAFDRLLTRPEFLGGLLAGQVFLFAAGVRTVRRRDSGIAKAVAASAKAALVPDIALVIASGFTMVSSWGFFSEMDGHTVCYWIAKNFAVTAITSLVFIVAGALLGRIVSRFRTCV